MIRKDPISLFIINSTIASEPLITKLKYHITMHTTATMRYFFYFTIRMNNLKNFPSVLFEIILCKA